MMGEIINEQCNVETCHNGKLLQAYRDFHFYFSLFISEDSYEKALSVRAIHCEGSDAFLILPKKVGEGVKKVTKSK